ncbi:hypothetical protein KFE25_005122 [Diacronema lutheri]|uniref:Response regulatory domain-containing protein n=1 Tax=Diacronema lutheri TaxID=2081491 RepID=A0A8J6C7Q9_DIALT|nr:hypothetical protein KFE25_005122 [Diacronema lutheri]
MAAGAAVSDERAQTGTRTAPRTSHAARPPSAPAAPTGVLVRPSDAFHERVHFHMRAKQAGERRSSLGSTARYGSTLALPTLAILAQAQATAETQAAADGAEGRTARPKRISLLGTMPPPPPPAPPKSAHARRDAAASAAEQPVLPGLHIQLADESPETPSYLRARRVLAMADRAKRRQERGLELASYLKTTLGGNVDDAQAKTPRPPTTSPPRRRPPAARAEPSAVRILIVDDEPVARKRVELLVRRFIDAETIVPAKDGVEAVRAVVAAGDAGFDLVIMDINMGGKSFFDPLNGPAAAYTIMQMEKQRKDARRTPLIFLSATSRLSASYRALYEVCGASAIASKPANNDFGKTAAALLQKSTEAAAHAAQPGGRALRALGSSGALRATAKYSEALTKQLRAVRSKRPAQRPGPPEREREPPPRPTGHLPAGRRILAVRALALLEAAFEREGGETPRVHELARLSARTGFDSQSVSEWFAHKRALRPRGDPAPADLGAAASVVPSANAATDARGQVGGRAPRGTSATAVHDEPDGPADGEARGSRDAASPSSPKRHESFTFSMMVRTTPTPLRNADDKPLKSEVAVERQVRAAEAGASDADAANAKRAVKFEPL